MAALRFQTGGRHQKSPSLPSGVHVKKEFKVNNNSAERRLTLSRLTHEHTHAHRHTDTDSSNIMKRFISE